MQKFKVLLFSIIIMASALSPAFAQTNSSAPVPQGAPDDSELVQCRADLTGSLEIIRRTEESRDEATQQYRDLFTANADLQIEYRELLEKYTALVINNTNIHSEHRELERDHATLHNNNSRAHGALYQLQIEHEKLQINNTSTLEANDSFRSIHEEYKVTASRILGEINRYTDLNDECMADLEFVTQDNNDLRKRISLGLVNSNSTATGNFTSIANVEQIYKDQIVNLNTHITEQNSLVLKLFNIIEGSRT